MKICLVGSSQSIHIVKWCRWFSEHGHEVHVISFRNDSIPGSIVHYINPGVEMESGDFKKIKYLFQVIKVRKEIKRINPDVVNAHYATSYGTVMALTGIKGYILSVWGSDVYDFPKKSLLHKLILKYSLYKADYIFSTSKAMAVEIKKYCNKKIEITPFGVDMEMFNPKKRKRNQDENKFVIGTIKKIDPKYGIDFLIKAASIIRKEHPEIPIEVRIAGEGKYKKVYQQLAKELGIEECVTWLGFISQSDAAIEWANMDVAVIASTQDSESFGVSVVEAQASGVAVIISDIPGLMETTIPKKTSIVVKRKDEKALADAILTLYFNKSMREEFARRGRMYVLRKYELNYCTSKPESFFMKIIGKMD